MQVIYMDGTFSITPALFAQVYVILAERSARVENGGKWVFPVLYALLKNKSCATYLKLFRMIRNLRREFYPAFFSVDFELAAIQALHEIFTGTLMDPPMFPVNMWSCYDKNLEGEDRTNNYAEAAHRRLQDALGVEHPTDGRLLQDLKRSRMTSTISNTWRELQLQERKESTEILMQGFWVKLSAIIELTPSNAFVD